MAAGVFRPMMGAVPLAVIVACSATAHADPQAGQRPPATTPVQPGTAAPESPQHLESPGEPLQQPGLTTPQPGPSAPADSGTGSLDYAVPQGTRPVPQYQSAPPIVPQELHAPVPVEPVAPIAPPPNVLRLGDSTTPVPTEVPADLLDGVNHAAAELEANVATASRSIGIDPARADKIAGGALLGAAAAGVPGAAIGAVGGGVLGAGVGFAVGVAGTAAGAGIVTAAAGIPTAGVAALPALGAALAAGIPVAGAATAVGAGIGAALGAAAVGIPAAAAGGIVGGAAGAQFG